MKVSTWNDDVLVTTTDWLTMTLRRVGRDEEASRLIEPITGHMDILENHSHHRRVLFYRGLVRPEELLDPQALTDLDLATQGYGVGNWYLAEGDTERARAIFRKIVESTYWPAFGFIAAEADLARMGDGREG